jgi:predicted nucleic acid-binding protein
MNPASPQSPPASPPLRHLLDVNVLLAAIWANHPQHAKAFAWLSGKIVILCPLSELGFLQKARDLLNQFATDRKAARIADNLPALDSHPDKSEEVTDHYLADLAALHGARLATLDQNLTHSAVDVIL